LIGIDTPEVFGGAECYGAEASAFTKRELDQRTVLVEFDVQSTDRFGRALVYVWHPDGRFFNARLASEGYAQQLTIPPNVKYADLFNRLVREARDGNRGLWAGCSAAEAAPAQPSQVADRDCPEFGSQAEAQSFYEEQGGPAQDPHNLDADNDGIACEASAPAPPPPEPAPATQAPSSGNCHPSYPDFCIAPPPPDLDCPQMSQKRFTVRHDVANPDPHGFDGDTDGIGCEG
jgi:micrococcal nuclease